MWRVKTKIKIKSFIIRFHQVPCRGGHFEKVLDKTQGFKRFHFLCNLEAHF